jgi:hypothetical protein
VGHHSGRGTTAAAMVHSVLADDDSYGVFGTSKHTDSYIRNNNRRVEKELQIFAILVAGSSVLRDYHGFARSVPANISWYVISKLQPPCNIDITWP